MTARFVHLHLHSQYSLMEGAIRLKALAKSLKKMEYPACAITDHGNMFGVVEFYQALKKEGIKPIIGLGAYVAKGSRKQHHYEHQHRGPHAYQTLLLCQNRQGYQNLIKLASLGFTEGKYYGIPRIDHELLEQYHEGLIALSGGLNGEITERLVNGLVEEAREVAAWYRDLFAGRYYLEVQQTGLPEQPEINAQIVALATELGIPLVGTNDCHYISEKDAEAHYILELMGLQKRITDHDIPPMRTTQRYLKNMDEMEAAFVGLPPEVLSNTLKIAEQCELSLENKTYYLPKYQIPPEHTLDSWLTKQAEDGLQKRLEHLYSLYQPSESFEEFRKPYDARLEFELRTIIQMKFPGYFLIVADFINWAKDHGIPVGPGRGSGAGSLVAYALRITDVDPLRYALLFERFLNPDRISMPDFDVDFEVDGREAVIAYVREHYGENNVCQIATFQTLAAKAALRAVARVLNFPYSEADKISKLIPNKLGITLEEALEQEPELRRMEQEGSDDEKKLISLAKNLEGLSTHLGTHAAGVIIMDCDIRDVMPVCTGKDHTLQSMFTMKYAEDQGAVKFDFLGLLNLSVIQAAVKLIDTKRPPEDPLRIDSLPMDDPLSFELFCRGDTTGVFQLESGGMKKLLTDMRPSVFEDIVAILALYRPGPLGSGMVDDFIQRKHGKKHVAYPHPLLEIVLKETYGVMVYQEQIMQAVQILANFSLGQADLLRRAIGKKIPEILAQQRQVFIKGCLDNPHFTQRCPSHATPEQIANEIFDLIDYFSGYGFNKSHTVAYGVVTYQTAWLKSHYPVQFMAALLNCSMSNPDKVMNFISECKEMGILVLPPDVNQSLKEFTVSPLDWQISDWALGYLRHTGLSVQALHALRSKRNERFASAEELRQAFVMFPIWEELKEHWAKIVEVTRIEAVRFGLNAVKNVGGNAVDAILEARQAKPEQKFKDIMDFMKSVDMTKVNKRVLETLVCCGAFDSLAVNRAQLYEVLDEAIHLGQEYQRAQEPSQNSLFDLLDAEEAQKTETALKLPDIKDWSMKRKLALEKEALGFYVSGHPLDRYLSEIQKMAITTTDLQEENRYKDGEMVTLAGIVVSKMIKLTKNAEKFAIIKLEDLRGSLELAIYARIYNEVKEILEADEPILLKGHVRHRDEEVGLDVREIKLLSQVRLENCRALHIELRQQILEAQQLRNLRGILMKYPGNCPVSFKVHTAEESVVTIRLEESITPAPAMVEELEDLVKSQPLHFFYGDERAARPAY